MVLIGKQSVGSTANLFQGYWSHVEFINNPLNDPLFPAQSAKYLGVVQEGNLEISREDTEYMGTNFPRRVEMLTPTQVGMKFSGQIDELHKTNLHIAVGDSSVSADNYIYPGAGCSFESQYGNLVVRRERCDLFVMEAVLWKTIGSGAVAIGGDAAVVGSSIEFNALDDSNGAFGGDPAVAPLGYLYAPDPAATSTDPN